MAAMMTISWRRRSQFHERWTEHKSINFIYNTREKKNYCSATFISWLLFCYSNQPEIALDVWFGAWNFLKFSNLELPCSKRCWKIFFSLILHSCKSATILIAVIVIKYFVQVCHCMAFYDFKSVIWRWKNI